MSKSAQHNTVANTDSKELYLHETRQTITLHFNHNALQSVMRKSEPYGLEFEYTKVMMGFMLFITEPKNILLVGLGGGSMSKFCHKHFPETVVTTIEISREVLAMRSTFMVPTNNDFFKVLEGDGAKYLSQKTHISEVILLDGYNGNGLPEVLCSEQFYADCYQALRPNGMLIANLWRKDVNFRRNLARINSQFDKRVVTVKCDSGNEIVFAFKGIELPPFDDVWKFALQLKKTTGLNFSQFLEDMVFSTRNAWFYTHV